MFLGDVLIEKQALRSIKGQYRYHASMGKFLWLASAVSAYIYLKNIEHKDDKLRF